MTLRHPKSACIAILPIALWGSAALAGETTEPQAEVLSEPLVVIAAPGDPASAGELLSLDELAEARGRATIVVNNQTLMAITGGNTIGNYAAGTINLSDNALSSFSGVGNFLFNTGAQNSLQTGMSLTITIE